MTGALAVNAVLAHKNQRICQDVECDGKPPALDYYAVFEAVGVVSVSLIVLIVYYLVQSPEMLNLRPPQDDHR